MGRADNPSAYSVIGRRADIHRLNELFAHFTELLFYPAFLLHPFREGRGQVGKDSFHPYKLIQPGGDDPLHSAFCDFVETQCIAFLHK